MYTRGGRDGEGRRERGHGGKGGHGRGGRGGGGGGGGGGGEAPRAAFPDTDRRVAEAPTVRAVAGGGGGRVRTGGEGGDGGNGGPGGEGRWRRDGGEMEEKWRRDGAEGEELTSALPPPHLLPSPPKRNSPAPSPRKRTPPRISWPLTSNAPVSTGSGPIRSGPDPAKRAPTRRRRRRVTGSGEGRSLRNGAPWRCAAGRSLKPTPPAPGSPPACSSSCPRGSRCRPGACTPPSRRRRRASPRLRP